MLLPAEIRGCPCKNRRSELFRRELGFEELAARSHPLGAPDSDKVFVSLIAYMDDSGTHRDSPNAVIAGYWGGVREWERFEWKWRKVLTEFRIDEFHANKFWPRLDGKRLEPFADWDDARHRVFIDKLLTVIEESKIVPFAYGVANCDWDKRFDFYKRIFTGPGLKKGLEPEPLFLSFQVAVAKTIRYCASLGRRCTSSTTKTSRTSPRLLRCYLKLQQESIADDDPLRFSFGDMIFSDSRDAVPLQAADLLAYEAHRYKKKSDGDPAAPLRNEYFRALRNFKSMDDFWIFDEPRLKSLEAQVEALAKE